MALYFTPARCSIDLGAISHNFRQLGDPARLMPVIKADAYGHGLLPVARALTRAGASSFAVGIASEGVALREDGFTGSILLLMGCQTSDDWQCALSYGLTPLIGSHDDLEAARALLSGHPGKNCEVAIKCDSGMGRLGFNAADGGALAESLASIPNLRPVLTVSHLACSDMPEKDSYTAGQAQKFTHFHAALQAAFPQIRPSLNNSAALLRKMPGDLARPGLAIYGGNPVEGISAPTLKWAMSVSAPILAVHALGAGESVSYGCLFTASRSMRIAVVPYGYATGFNRRLSGNSSMLVHGRRCPQIGRICMSMAMLDVSAVPEAKAGDQAWILGGEPMPGETPVDAWELARKLDTIPYEILCLFGGLTPRIYNG